MCAVALRGRMERRLCCVTKSPWLKIQANQIKDLFLVRAESRLLLSVRERMAAATGPTGLPAAAVIALPPTLQ